MSNGFNPPDIEKFLPPPPDVIIQDVAATAGDLVNALFSPVRALGKGVERFVSNLSRFGR